MDFSVKILSFLIGIGAISIEYGKEKSVELTEEIIETTFNIISDSKTYISKVEIFKNILYFLHEIVAFFVYKLPEIVMIVFSNLLNFTLIFCALVVIGKFDFVLESTYSILIVSFLLTYVLGLRL